MKAASISELDGVPLEHHHIQINGLKLHYVAAGQGPLVLLLHGFPEFWYGWRKQIPALARHFRVVAPDLPGYGQSDKPRKVSRVRMSALRADMQELIRGLGQEKARVVAHDWGGAIAWDMAIRAPEYLERVALLNIPHPALLFKALRKNPRQILRSWYFFYFQLPGIPEWAFRMRMRRTVRDTFQGWAHRPDAFDEQDLELYEDNLRQPGVLRSAINYYRASMRYMRSQSRGLETPIPVPLRLIWGENDKALGKELSLGTEAYVKAPCDIQYIPDCSHWVMSEYPERVNALLTELLLPDDPTILTHSS